MHCTPGLSRNSLTVILPGAFADMSQLEELYLQDNYLNSFGAAAFANGVLELAQPMRARDLLHTLHLERNRIETVDNGKVNLHTGPPTPLNKQLETNVL